MRIIVLSPCYCWLGMTSDSAVELYRGPDGRSLAHWNVNKLWPLDVCGIDNIDILQLSWSTSTDYTTLKPKRDNA